MNYLSNQTHKARNPTAMKPMPEHRPKDYSTLVDRIAESYVSGQRRVAQAVNAGLLQTYWEIGRHIVEFEQGGSATAEYGKRLLEQLSTDLSALCGKGFSLSNVKRFRQFYLAYQNGATLSHQFGWSYHSEHHRLATIDLPPAKSCQVKKAAVRLHRQTLTGF
jgi:hypothetical protein